jgi:hypothetical protein
VSRLQEVFGGNAVSDEYGIGRHVANLFVTQTYEGQSDIHGKYTVRMVPEASLISCSVDPRSINHGSPSVLLIPRVPKKVVKTTLMVASC